MECKKQFQSSLFPFFSILKQFFSPQRRLSDPSANFNTFMNSGWRARPGCEGGSGRSRSENEGLDCFADGLYEIESGDVRDGEWDWGRWVKMCGEGW